MLLSKMMSNPCGFSGKCWPKKHTKILKNEKTSRVCTNKSCMLLGCERSSPKIIKLNKVAHGIPVFFSEGNEDTKTENKLSNNKAAWCLKLWNMQRPASPAVFYWNVQNLRSLILLNLWVTGCCFLRGENVICCHLNVWMCVSGYCVQEGDQIFRNGGSSQTCVCKPSILWNPGKCCGIQWFYTHLDTQKTETILITQMSTMYFSHKRYLSI